MEQVMQTTLSERSDHLLHRSVYLLAGYFTEQP